MLGNKTKNAPRKNNGKENKNRITEKKEYKWHLKHKHMFSLAYTKKNVYLNYSEIQFLTYQIIKTSKFENTPSAKAIGEIRTQTRTLHSS